METLCADYKQAKQRLEELQSEAPTEHVRRMFDLAEQMYLEIPPHLGVYIQIGGK